MKTLGPEKKGGVMADRSTRTTAALLDEFEGYAASIAKGGDPYVIFLKCISIRSIWNELRSRGVPVPWEEARDAANPLRHGGLGDPGYGLMGG